MIIGCAPAKQVHQSSLPGSALMPAGRYEKKGPELHFISSGMYAGFSFIGKQCTLYVSSPGQHNYLQYELDGVYQKRLRVDTGAVQTIVINAEKKGKHQVWLYKTTEASTGPLLVHKIEGPRIIALPLPQKPFIEFIGNSITCGAAADTTDVPCGTGAYHDQHNAYMAYAPRIARTLQTNFVLSSVSGIGIYRNWNSNGSTMPQVYEQTSLQQDNTPAWDFNQFKPSIVSIALGTNDFSRGAGVQPRQPFDSSQFVQQYILFVQKVKQKYPEAQIALLSSPMVHGANNLLLQNCLKAVKEAIDTQYNSGKKVVLFFFQPMQAGGCTGHPSVSDHAMMANEALPFFKSLLESGGELKN